MTWNQSTSIAVPPVQLSDGTCVILAGGSLYWTTDRTTLNLVGPLGTQSRLHAATLCRDANDNLYVAGLIASNIGSGYAQAFVKGAGRTWTAQTEQFFAAGAAWVSGGSQSGAALHGRAGWTSTGGTVGAGQIVVPYQDTNGVVGVVALDAGALLSSGTPGLYAATSYGTADLGMLATAQDGFGNPDGWIVAELTTLYVYYWTVTASGVTMTVYTASIPGGAVAASEAALIQYAAGAAMFFLGNVIAELSPTAPIYGPALFTVPSGAQVPLADATYVRSVGRVWVYAQSSVYSLARFGVTPGSPPTVDAAAVAEQTNGSGWVNSQAPTDIYTSDFAFGTADYLEATVAGTVYGSSTLYASAPNAATLTAPTSGTYLDASTSPTLTAVYHSADGAPANAFALRLKTDAGAYGYLRTSDGTLQSTPQWNACTVADGATLAITLPAGMVTNGHTETWSVAFQEAYGNLQGPFATDFVFTTQAAPTLTITGPSGTSTTAQPTITWTATPASGLSITGYQLIVEQGAYGTTPGSGTQLADTGVVAGNPGQAQVPVVLANGSTSRAFVQVTETNGEVSTWQHVDLDVTYTPLATPTLTVTPDTDPITGAPRMAVTVRGGDSIATVALLTRVDPSNTTGITVRGAAAVTVPYPGQEATVYDYEAPIGAGCEYTAVVSAAGRTSTLSAAYGATLTPTQGWLTDPQDTTLALPLRRLRPMSSGTISAPVSLIEDSTEEQGVFYAFDRPDPIIQRGETTLGTVGLSFLLYGYTEKAMLRALRDGKRTLLWRSDMGDQWYGILGDLPLATLRDIARVTDPYTAVTTTFTLCAAP